MAQPYHTWGLTALGLMFGATAAFAQPANDNFANAITLSDPLPISLAFDNTDATVEPGEPNPNGHFGATIFYRYTASATPPSGIRVSTAGSSFDTVLGVYTGSSVSSLTRVVFNDDINSTDLNGPADNTSQVAFAPMPGQTYYIQVSGYNGSTGSGTHTLSATTFPSNDNFADAVELTSSGAPIVVVFNNVDATLEAGEPTQGVDIGATLFYRYTAPSSPPAAIRVSTGGSLFDTVLGVYTGPSVDNLTQIGYNDDVNPSTDRTSQVVFTPVASQTYYIQVAGFQGGIGNGTLAIAGQDALGNDAPLPVELSSFLGAARDGSVELSWRTVTETNNAGFVVLRAIAGSTGAPTIRKKADRGTVGPDYQVIGDYRTAPALRGQGTSSAAHLYQFSDRTARPGVRYVYQLHSIDLSGQIHRYDSRVELLAGSTTQTTPTTFELSAASPNPFNPATSLRLSLHESAVVTATLYNALGQPVRTLMSATSMEAGERSLTVDATGLATGHYVVRVVATTATSQFSQSRQITLVK